MKIIYLIALFGLSSVLSAFALNQSGDYRLLFYAPGVIYGITLSIYLFYEHIINIWKIILLIIFSTLAWFLAYFSGAITLLPGAILSGLIGSYVIATIIQGMGLLNDRAQTIVAGMLASIPSWIIFWGFARSGGGFLSSSPLEWLLIPSILAFAVWQIPVGIMIHLGSRNNSLDIK